MVLNLSKTILFTLHFRSGLYLCPTLLNFPVVGSNNDVYIGITLSRVKHEKKERRKNDFIRDTITYLGKINRRKEREKKMWKAMLVTNNHLKKQNRKAKELIKTTEKEK
jgi:hypothetical protein